MHSFTVLHAPSHGPSLTRAAIHKALALNPDSMGMSEAYMRIPWLMTRPGYKCIVGHSKTDPRRGAHDNPILTKKEYKTLFREAYKACGPSFPRRIAPERWNTSHGFQVNNTVKIAHFAVHPNAAIHGHSRLTPRVRAYAKQMKRLEKSIKRRQAEGYLIVVTGDLNFPHLPGKAPSYSPQELFKRLHLEYTVNGIDWIAHSHGLIRQHMSSYPPSWNGQDHPWLKVTFGIRP